MYTRRSLAPPIRFERTTHGLGRGSARGTRSASGGRRDTSSGSEQNAAAAELPTSVHICHPGRDGLHHEPDAAGAVSLRSKLGHAIELIDAGDVAGARAVLVKVLAGQDQAK